MRADLLFDRFIQTSDLVAVLQSARMAAARASGPLVMGSPSDFAPLLDEAVFGSGTRERCASLPVPSGVLHPAVASLLGDLLELESEALMRVARGQAWLSDGAIQAPAQAPAQAHDQPQPQPQAQAQTGIRAIVGLLSGLPADDPAMRSVQEAGIGPADLILRSIPVPPPSVRPFQKNELGQLLPRPDTLTLAAVAAAANRAAQVQDAPDPDLRHQAELHLQAVFEQWIGMLCGLVDWAEWLPLDLEAQLATSDVASDDDVDGPVPTAADLLRAVPPSAVLDTVSASQVADAFGAEVEHCHRAPDVTVLPDGPDVWLTYPQVTLGLELTEAGAVVQVALPSCGLSPTAISANGKRVLFAFPQEVAPHAPRRAVFDRESGLWPPKPYPDTPAAVLGWVRWHRGSPLDMDYQLMRWRPLFPTFELVAGDGHFICSPTGRYVWHTSTRWVVDRDDMLPCLDLQPIVGSEPVADSSVSALVHSAFHGWLVAHRGVLYQNLEARFDYGTENTPVAFDEDARRLFFVKDEQLCVRPLATRGGTLTVDAGQTYDLRRLGDLRDLRETTRREQLPQILPLNTDTDAGS